MVDNQNTRLDLIFHALSDTTRRAMLAQLSESECSVSELAAPHQQTFAGISKHLKVLESAELVKKSKNGRIISCRANLTPLNEVHQLLEDLGLFWRQRLDALEEFFTDSNSTTKEKEDGSTSKEKRSSKGNSKKINLRRSRKGV